MRFLFRIGLGLLLLGTVTGVRAEPSHQSGAATAQRRGSFHDRVGFLSVSYQEIYPNESQPELAIQGEQGSLNQGEESPRRAIRIYQGVKGRPGGRLDLIATAAGKARTFIAASRACEKLVPLGEWRLATVPQIMAFFGGLVEGVPMPENPERRGFLFWAASTDEQENKKNKDSFYAAWGSGGPELETHSYRDFNLLIKRSISQSKNAAVKANTLNLLKSIQDGIPVICVGGVE